LFSNITTTLSNMNYLGIDYGRKRIGLSFGDNDLRIAVPITPIIVRSDADTLIQLQLVINQRKVNEIIIGYPYNLDGSVSDTAREVDRFISLLEARFSLPVHRIDEQLTSYQASSSNDIFLKKSQKSLKKRIEKRRSATLDSQSAALILQDFLDNFGCF